MTPWRVVAALLGAAAYLLLSHWLTLHSAGQPWALAAFLGPFWVVAWLVALHKRQWIGLFALLLLALAVAAIVARGGIGDVNRLYVLQHAGIHAALFVSFALSLRPGQLSLIGRLATRVHGSMTPDMAAYSQRVTIAWALYFSGMTLLSLLVYAVCDWNTWSLLANVATPIAIAALFVGEYLLRYWLHPEFERATLLDAARAWQHADKTGPTAPR